ncbi:MAG: hypothetical protein KIS92_16965 [Planctomycetota bacterium]|nr:hypothetical protein [Planctomycetota bacterium]
MQTNILRRTVLFAAAWGLLGVAAQAHACNVPVFRYALERWQPDAFGALVYYKGALSGEPAQALELLEKRLAAPEARYNVYVQRVDRGTKMDEPTEQLWKSAGSPEAPTLVIQFPHHSMLHEPAWSAPLTKANVEQLLESPARRELARRILKGDSAVWLQVDGTDVKKNDEIFALLNEENKRLLELVRLPPPDDPDAKPLKPAFSVLRIAAGDPAEAFFLSALAAQYKGAGDAAADAAQGIVGPVFGQGRLLALAPLPTMTSQHVEDAVAFLTGACSCIVKEQNPGVDLLIGADWLTLIDKPVVVDKELPALSGFTPPAEDPKDVAKETKAPVEAPAAAPASAPPAAEAPGLFSGLALLAVAGVAAVLIASVFVLRGKREA